MRTPNKQVIAEALEFAARWGFLNHKIFFEFICQMSPAQQYRYWSYLVESGLFMKSKYSPNNLILSKKGRVCFGGSARPARSHFYVDHDIIVARFFLALEKRGLILNSWLEDELMRHPGEAKNIIGASETHRIPDLIFDLKTANNTSVRCALEIERVTKSRSRYSKIALAYLNANRIGVILFGCVHPTTEKVVRGAFSTSAHLMAKRIPGIFLFDEFNPTSLSTLLRFHDNHMTLEKFIEVATKHPVPQMRNTGEKLDSMLSRKIDEKSEAS